MSKHNDKDMSAVSPVERGRRPTGTGETKAAPKRFWAQHKTEAVLRLLRGEDIETLSRKLGVTAAKLSQWREAFLAAGAESLKKRSPAEKAEYKPHSSSGAGHPEKGREPSGLMKPKRVQKTVDRYTSQGLPADKR